MTRPGVDVRPFASRMHATRTTLLSPSSWNMGPAGHGGENEERLGDGGGEGRGGGGGGGGHRR